MRRRDFVVLLGSSAVCQLTAPRAFSQQLAGIPRVGVLVSASEPHPFADALRRGLERLGYSDGRNIALDVRYTQGRSDRAAELANELVRNGVTIIVAHFTPAVRAAMSATKTIPIVMAPAGAPLQSGFIKSLAEPGGNVTGLSGMDAELGGKRIQLLRELIPNLTCVGVLATPTTDPFSQPFVADIQAAASTAKLKTTPVLVSGPNEFDDAFSIMAKDGAQAVIVQGFFGPYAKAVVPIANGHRIGYMSTDRSAVGHRPNGRQCALMTVSSTGHCNTARRSSPV
jgi:putative ABC transport system substrate-binding protein